METNINDIKKLLENDRNNLAVIIGNGIHLYQKYCLGINYGLDWISLLLDLWKNVIGTPLKDIPKGVSYTEFYDIVELHKSLNYSKSSLYKSITHNDKNILTDLRLSQEGTKQLAKTTMELAMSTNYKSAILHQNLNKQNKELIDKSKKFLNNLNIDTESYKSIDYINTMINYLSNHSIRKLLTNNIKQHICDNMLEWSNNDSILGTNSVIYKITHQLQELKYPILTTNYDTTFSSSLECQYLKVSPIYDESKKIISYINAHKGFSDYYAWNGYFGKDDVLRTNPTDCFGVWHINGVAQYPRSIKLGLCDYMGSVEKARNMIQGNDGLELFNGKYQNHWVGENTWLHLIFNKSLLIIGLSLDENEVFLRWLLLQRAKYFAMYNIHHKGWYVITKQDLEEKPGKKFFLNNVGFDVVVVDKYDDIYQSLWE